MGLINLNGVELPVVNYSAQPLGEYASAIREGVPRRVDRAYADFREEGGGYPLGLGYRRGRPQDVVGGLWKSELRVEIPGQITLPLEMESETDALGDLSGLVAVAGRMASCNTDLGNSSAKKRLYIGIGTKLARTVSDSDFSIEDSTWTPPAGVDRIHHIGEFKINSLTYLGIAHEDPTGVADRGLRVTTNPTATPPVFSEIENGPAVDGGPRSTWWFVSIDALQRTYFHASLNAGGTWGTPLAGEWLAFFGYTDALSASPTFVGSVNALKQGDQIAGVIGLRIWVLTPLQNAATAPNATKILKYIDIERQHQIVEVATRTRNVTQACAYDHPYAGPGIFYTDGKSAYWTNGDTHIPLGWLRHQGRDVACTIKGLNPTGDRIGVLVQADDNLSAWYEEYIPTGQGRHLGYWVSFSKRITTAAALVLPGGTERGTTLPWGAEGMRRYFVDPAAVNSTVWRQKHYGNEDRSNPLTTSVGVDDFEDGPLSAEFPMYDAWGGPEETGRLMQGYFEGDSNVSATSTVLWEYTTDQSTYPDFATYTAVDQETDLGSGGVTARRFGLRCTLDRGATATVTPNGAPFVARGNKEPDARLVHSYEIAVTKLSKKAQEDLRSTLLTARDAKAVRLIAGDLDTYVSVNFSLEGDAGDSAAAKMKPTKASVTCVELL